MAAQTRPPDEWVIVDDGSDDGTGELLAALAGEVPFMRVVIAGATSSTRPRSTASPWPPRRAPSTSASLTGRDDFTHVAKLDGDVELPPDYYEELLARFAGDGRSASPAAT